MLCCSFPSSLSHLAVSLMQQIKKKCCSTKYCHAIFFWGYGNDLLSARKCSIAVFKVVPWVQRNGEVLLIYISGYNCCQALGQREILHLSMSGCYFQRLWQWVVFAGQAACLEMQVHILECYFRTGVSRLCIELYKSTLGVYKHSPSTSRFSTLFIWFNFHVFNREYIDI